MHECSLRKPQVCVCQRSWEQVCTLLVQDTKCAYGFRCLRVCLSCECCRQAASGQLSFVWGLVACWQSQSLRITSPSGSLSLRHKPKDRHSDKQTAGPFCSGPFPLLLPLDSIILTHRRCCVKKPLIPILGILFFYNVQYMLNSFYDLNIYKTHCH